MDSFNDIFGQTLSTNTSKNTMHGILSAGTTATVGIFTIGFIFLQALFLLIVFYVFLKRKNDAQKALTPDNKDLPSNGTLLGRALLWAVGYFIVNVVINIISGGLLAFAGVIMFALAFILYFTFKNAKFGVKDLVNAQGEKVGISDFSYWLGAFLTAYILTVIVVISISIARYFIVKKMIKVSAPILAQAANVIVPGSSSIVSNYI